MLLVRAYSTGEFESRGSQAQETSGARKRKKTRRFRIDVDRDHPPAEQTMPRTRKSKVNP